VNTLQNVEAFQYFQKQEDLFNVLNRKKKFKSNCLTKPFFMDAQKTQNLTPLPLYTEDVLLSPSLISLKNFSVFNNEVFMDSSDDSYESLKYLTYIHSLNSKNTLNFDRNAISPISYAQVIDNFRADYEDPQ
jgi:hypothetical protein